MRSREDLLHWALNHPQLAPLLVSAEKNNSDPAHDFSHLLRVALWTIRLAPTVDPVEATAAALLHDLVNLPKDHPDRARASEYSASAAAPLLQQTGFEKEAVERICGAIRDHSYSRGAIPSSPLGKALQDADRLEALGAIGLMRNFATGVRMKAQFFDSKDPWAKNRALDDKRFSIDHFFTKLLRLPAGFQTEAGRREAERRAEILEKFLGELATELGEPRA